MLTRGSNKSKEQRETSSFCKRGERIWEGDFLYQTLECFVGVTTAVKKDLEPIMDAL